MVNDHEMCFSNIKYVFMFFSSQMVNLSHFTMDFFGMAWYCLFGIMVQWHWWCLLVEEGKHIGCRSTGDVRQRIDQRVPAVSTHLVRTSIMPKLVQARAEGTFGCVFPLCFFHLINLAVQPKRIIVFIFFSKNNVSSTQFLFGFGVGSPSKAIEKSRFLSFVAVGTTRPSSRHLNSSRVGGFTHRNF